MKKAAFICVTRNNAEKLQATLNSIILNTKAENYDLIIIDNASSDSTLGIYQQRVLADHITIVRSGKNLNWVGGINLGLEMTRGYQYVGFLNDDIEVCPNWLENFFDVLDCNPDTAAVGPITSNTRDAQCYDLLQKNYPQFDFNPLEGISRADQNAMLQALSSHGTGAKVPFSLAFFCILLRRSSVDVIGVLDPAFADLYFGEDEDYCQRLRDAGHTLALSFRSYVLHHAGSSSLLIADENDRRKKAAEIIARKNLVLKPVVFSGDTSEAHTKPDRNKEKANSSTSVFVRMKPLWEPLLQVMPFFDQLATLVPVSRPFFETESYVFNPGKPLALCMLYTPEIVAYGCHSEKSVLSYCARHDYTAYIYRNRIYNDIHPTWHKARILLNHLSSHKSLVWLDSDTLILRQEEEVFANISKSAKPLHVSRDLPGGATAYNAGVILFKNHPWARQLLEDWDAFALQHKPKALWDHGSDQTVLCDLIQQRDPHGEFHEAHEMSEFNTDPRFMDENTFLLHFMAYPSGYKIPWMHYWNANHLDFREADFLDRIKPL